MEEIEVPAFFVCPISLEIMKDPVTISTGITYDRHSIETWLFSSSNNNKTCPVTKQPVSTDSVDLITPNLTLFRLIQSWCSLNASRGVERIPTPKPPVSKPYVQKLLTDARSPALQAKCLKRLRSIATSQNGSARRCMESAGAVEFLASLVNSECSTSEEEETVDYFDARALTDDALCILYNLQLTESGLRQLVHGGQFVDSLIQVMLQGSYDSRAYAVLLLKSMFEVAEPMEMITLQPDFFHEIVQVLHDGISPQVTKGALKLLIHVCPWGRSRIKAVEAGVVRVLVEMLLESSEKRICELALMLLEMACQSAEGRAELLRHSAGVAIVSKKILRVSQMASERAVRILHSLAMFSATAVVVQEMLEIGVAAKLCLVLQVESGKKTKAKATEILHLHGRVWRNSPCIPANLASCYPLPQP